MLFIIKVDTKNGGLQLEKVLSNFSSIQKYVKFVGLYAVHH